MDAYNNARNYDHQGQRIVELENEVKMWKDHSELLTKTIETLTNNYERELKDNAALAIMQTLMSNHHCNDDKIGELIEQSYGLAERFVEKSKEVNNVKPKAS